MRERNGKGEKKEDRFGFLGGKGDKAGKGIFKKNYPARKTVLLSGCRVACTLSPEHNLEAAGLDVA